MAPVPCKSVHDCWGTPCLSGACLGGRSHLSPNGKEGPPTALCSEISGRTGAPRRQVAATEEPTPPGLAGKHASPSFSPRHQPREPGGSGGRLARPPRAAVGGGGAPPRPPRGGGGREEGRGGGPCPFGASRTRYWSKVPARHGEGSSPKALCP